MEQINKGSVRRLPRLSAGIVVQVVSRDGQLKLLTPLVEAHGAEVVIGRLPDSTVERERYFSFNQTLLVRTSDQGVLYSCETQVVDVSLHRARLRMNTAPREIYRQYQRMEQRYDCALCAYLHGHCAVQDGRVENISVSGCQLVVSDPRVITEIQTLQSQNKPLGFEVMFPHCDQYQHLQGNVVSFIDRLEDSPCRVGLEFCGKRDVVTEYIQLLRLS
ncbi:PilZ domain-containing protein [Pontibacterium granulatum]|uniref:PilZ domain-containing protein n=1 Tax=Pontibacterium granulatum TaxID=2036029 RepID=UPI00249C0796|nr:PilZ domain-containing protein [Pontibacterium granulatum]MDI3324392.1 PilZ domain-containing protein [Pontibacterium granulatum]